MTDICASDVKELRDQTSCGMMECKTALVDAEGDMKKAKELLRERGLAKASHREGRTTNEGLVRVKVSDRRVACVSIRCETDFVANCAEMSGLADDALKLFLEAKSPQEINEKMSVLEKLVSMTVKENVKIDDGHCAEFDPEQRSVFVYNHGNRVASYVVVSDNCSEEFGKTLAMQIAANNPLAINQDDMNAELVTEEREFVTKEAEGSGKPADIVEKMVKGRMNKFFKEHCLEEQPLLTDDSKTVAKLAKELGVTIYAISRMEAGS